MVRFSKSRVRWASVRGTPSSRRPRSPGSVVGADQPRGGKISGKLQNIAQFPHVARPVVLPQALRGVHRQMKIPAQFVGQLVQNGLGQDGDIARALPQGRDPDGKGVQTVVQVFAEFAAADVFRQVGIAGCDDPHVHLRLLYRPDRTHPMLLEGPQQLGLEADVHFRHLVQEQGAAVGGLEQAHLAALPRPGKGPSA